MTDFPFTEDVVLLNSGDTARKGHYVEFGLHPHPDGWIKPGMANPFNEIAQGREKGQRFRITVHLLADDETTTEDVSRETWKPEPASKLVKGGPLSQEAGRLCTTLSFQGFLSLWLPTRGAWLVAHQELNYPAEEAAASVVRERCGVKSRADIDYDLNAAQSWKEITDAYYASQRGQELEQMEGMQR